MTDSLPSNLTPLELASILLRSANALGRCVCGGEARIIGRREMVGSIEVATESSHEEDCPVVLVLGKGVVYMDDLP